MGGNKKLIKKILVVVVALISFIYYFVIIRDYSLKELISNDFDDNDKIIKNSELLLSKMIDAIDIY